MYSHPAIDVRDQFVRYPNSIELMVYMCVGLNVERRAPRTVKRNASTGLNTSTDPAHTGLDVAGAGDKSVKKTSEFHLTIDQHDEKLMTI
jgi:hypothetical protein